MLKSDKKIITTSLDGVGQQRFFYALKEYTEKEEMVLKELVERWSSDDVIKITRGFYGRFTSYSKIKRALQSMNTSGLDMKQLALFKCFES